MPFYKPRMTINFYFNFYIHRNLRVKINYCINSQLSILGVFTQEVPVVIGLEIN